MSQTTGGDDVGFDPNVDANECVKELATLEPFPFSTLHDFNETDTFNEDIHEERKRETNALGEEKKDDANRRNTAPATPPPPLSSFPRQFVLYREQLCRCLSHVASGGTVPSEELRVALQHAVAVMRERVESPAGVFPRDAEIERIISADRQQRAQRKEERKMRRRAAEAERREEQRRRQQQQEQEQQERKQKGAVISAPQLSHSSGLHNSEQQYIPRGVSHNGGRATRIITDDGIGEYCVSRRHRRIAGLVARDYPEDNDRDINITDVFANPHIPPPAAVREQERNDPPGSYSTYDRQHDEQRPTTACPQAIESSLASPPNSTKPNLAVGSDQKPSTLAALMLQSFEENDDEEEALFFGTTKRGGEGLDFTEFGGSGGPIAIGVDELDGAHHIDYSHVGGTAVDSSFVGQRAQQTESGNEFNHRATGGGLLTSKGGGEGLCTAPPSATDSNSVGDICGNGNFFSFPTPRSSSENKTNDNFDHQARQRSPPSPKPLTMIATTGAAGVIGVGPGEIGGSVGGSPLDVVGTVGAEVETANALLHIGHSEEEHKGFKPRADHQNTSDHYEAYYNGSGGGLIGGKVLGGMSNTYTSSKREGAAEPTNLVPTTDELTTHQMRDEGHMHMMMFMSGEGFAEDDDFDDGFGNGGLELEEEDAAKKTKMEEADHKETEEAKGKLKDTTVSERMADVPRKSNTPREKDKSADCTITAADAFSLTVRGIRDGEEDEKIKSQFSIPGQTARGEAARGVVGAGVGLPSRDQLRQQQPVAFATKGEREEGNLDSVRDFFEFKIGSSDREQHHSGNEDEEGKEGDSEDELDDEETAHRVHPAEAFARRVRNELGTLNNIVSLPFPRNETRRPAANAEGERSSNKREHDEAKEKDEECDALVIGPVRGHAYDLANLLLDEVFTIKSKKRSKTNGKRSQTGSKFATKDGSAGVESNDESSDPALSNEAEVTTRQFAWPKKNRCIVFLGNLIDGGQQSVEVLTICCWLLLALPRQVVILKGAHELLFPISNECTSLLVGRLDKELKLRFTKPLALYAAVRPVQPHGLAALRREEEEKRRMKRAADGARAAELPFTASSHSPSPSSAVGAITAENVSRSVGDGRTLMILDGVDVVEVDGGISIQHSRQTSCLSYSQSSLAFAGGAGSGAWAAAGGASVGGSAGGSHGHASAVKCYPFASAAAAASASLAATISSGVRQQTVSKTVPTPTAFNGGAHASNFQTNTKASCNTVGSSSSSSVCQASGAGGAVVSASHSPTLGDSRMAPAAGIASLMAYVGDLATSGGVGVGGDRGDLPSDNSRGATAEGEEGNQQRRYSLSLVRGVSPSHSISFFTTAHQQLVPQTPTSNHIGVYVVGGRGGGGAVNDSALMMSSSDGVEGFNFTTSGAYSLSATPSVAGSSSPVPPPHYPSAFSAAPAQHQQQHSSSAVPHPQGHSAKLIANPMTAEQVLANMRMGRATAGVGAVPTVAGPGRIVEQVMYQKQSVSELQTVPSVADAARFTMNPLTAEEVLANMRAGLVAQQNRSASPPHISGPVTALNFNPMTADEVLANMKMVNRRGAAPMPNAQLGFGGGEYHEDDEDPFGDGGDPFEGYAEGYGGIGGVSKQSVPPFASGTSYPSSPKHAAVGCDRSSPELAAGHTNSAHVHPSFLDMAAIHHAHTHGVAASGGSVRGGGGGSPSEPASPTTTTGIASPMGMSLRQHLRNSVLFHTNGIPTSLGPSPFASLPPPCAEDDLHIRYEAYYAVEKAVYELFDTFPLGVVVNNKYFCTTGGIPATLTSIEDVNTKINRFIEGGEDGLDFERCCEIVFSDPMDDDDEARLGPMALFANNLERGLSHTFSYNAACRFLAHNKLLSIIRANSFTTHRFSKATNLSGRPWHYQYSQFDVGYRLYRRNPTTRLPTVMSIFSAPGFQSTNRNIAAFVELPAEKSKSSSKNREGKKRSHSSKRRKKEHQHSGSRSHSQSNPLAGNACGGTLEEREKASSACTSSRAPSIAIRQFTASPSRPLQLPGTSANAFAWSVELMSHYATSFCAALLADTTYAPESMYVDGAEELFYALDKHTQDRHDSDEKIKVNKLLSAAPCAKKAKSDECALIVSTENPQNEGEGGKQADNPDENTAALSRQSSSSRVLTVSSDAAESFAGRKFGKHIENGEKTIAAHIDEEIAGQILRAKRLVPSLATQEGPKPSAEPFPATRDAKAGQAAEALLEQYKRKLIKLCVLVAAEGIPVDVVRSAILPSGSRATSTINTPQNVSLSFGQHSMGYGGGVSNTPFGGGGGGAFNHFKLSPRNSLQ